jgi:enterochelin esterase-like enzyme
MRARVLFTALSLGLLTSNLAHPAPTAGRIVDVELDSRALSGNLIGVDPKRRIKVYLPASYGRSSVRYPVVYYIHNYHWSPRQTFGENRLHEFFERAVARGQLGEVILVAGDFTTPTGFNLFGNDVVAGRWIDHIADELMPFVDGRFRTRATAASRGLAGDFFGAFASLKVAMVRPGVFGAVYALHPVGTGTGVMPGTWRPDWQVVHAAKSWEDLHRDTYAPVYVAMAQAYLPNPDRPPFFCDFIVEPQDGELKAHISNITKLQTRFHLIEQLVEHAEALKQLRALKIDWGRYDETHGHVYANQAFTRKLEGYGVTHFAEEYSGNQWNRLWTPHGRVERDLLPFFADFLEGAEPVPNK